jgi:general secretion pathway protein G
MKQRLRKIFGQNQGFTLMELLIVMVILSILVAIATGTYASSSKRGRDNRRKNDLRSVATALETYYSDKGRYPTGTNGVIMGCGAGDSGACPWGDSANGFRDQYGTLYMVLIPSDPLDSQTYYYVSSGTNYKLYAKLENTRDAGDGVKQDGYAGTDCDENNTVMCNYGIASANTTP